jgi:hypothetical protein
MDDFFGKKEEVKPELPKSPIVGLSIGEPLVPMALP